MKRDPSRANLSLAERLLCGYLYRHCRGAARARTYARIVADLGDRCDLDARSIYDVVAAVQEAGRPVGTTSGQPPGAFICVTARDWRIAYRNLYGRVHRPLRRARRLKQAFREWQTGQTYLELQADEELYETTIHEGGVLFRG